MTGAEWGEVAAAIVSVAGAVVAYLNQRRAKGHAAVAKAAASSLVKKDQANPDPPRRVM